MSIVLITKHDEVIYDIERRLDEATASSIKKIYAQKIFSKLSRDRNVMPTNQLRDAEGKIHITNSTKYSHKTFGRAREPVDYKAQCSFLKKGAGVHWQRDALHSCEKGSTMPRLPTFKKDTTAEKNCVNIIKRNVDRVNKSCPKKPLPKYIDTPKGSRHELIDSGLVPQYICSKTFGKVPAYVKRNKKQFEEMKARCIEEERQRELACFELGIGKTKMLTQEDRKKLLEGLQANFNELNGVYQKLSLYTDTLTKAMRKSRMEKTLTELENNIKMLQEHPIIYVRT